MLRTVLLIYLTCILVALTGACSGLTGETGAAGGPAGLFAGGGTTDQAPTGLEALPGIGGLDRLRAASAQAPLDVTTPVDEDYTTVIGSNLGFSAPAGQIAYAVFRITPPLETVVSIAAGGADGLYLLVADYGADKWAGATEFIGGFAVADLTALGHAFSPAGYVYCAVVAPPGLQGQLTSLALNYDGPAQIYYVAPPADGGNDENDGSSSTPWATLQHAANQAGPDTLVIVRPGTYAPFHFATSGSDGSPIVFKAEAGTVVDATGAGFGIDLGDLSWITVDGFTVQNALGAGIHAVSISAKSQHNTIRNNIIAYCATFGIAVAFSDYAVVEGNDISGVTDGDALQIGYDSDHAIIRHNIVHDNSISGIALYNGPYGDNSLDDELIEGNTCFNNGLNLACGISADGLNNSTIRNNLVYNNGVGIAFTALNGAPCTGNLLANNTVVQGTSAGVFGSCVWLADYCIDNKLYNNVLLNTNGGTGALEITTESLQGFMSDNNIVTDMILLDMAPQTLSQWQAATLRDTASLPSIPALTFVNPDLPDYHLLGTASAINAALSAYAPAEDRDGTARPQGGASDCGCYEFVP